MCTEDNEDLVICVQMIEKSMRLVQVFSKLQAKAILHSEHFSHTFVKEIIPRSPFQPQY